MKLKEPYTGIDFDTVPTSLIEYMWCLVSTRSGSWIYECTPEVYSLPGWGTGNIIASVTKDAGESIVNVHNVLIKNLHRVHQDVLND